MGYIHCCSGRRRSVSYRLEPDLGYLICEVDYLECCPVCGHTVLQLTRIDINNKVSIIKKNNKKARLFFEKIKNKIIYEKKIINNKGGFYLNYNEYGRKKRCYSNLSALKIGLVEQS